MTSPTSMKRAGRRWAAWAALVPAAFLGVFFVFPVVALLWRGLGENPGSIIDVMTSQSFRSVLWFTTWQAAASVLATFALAAPLTWVLGRYRFRGRRWVLALVTVPFVLPTVVVASAFSALLDRLGLDGGGGVDLRFSAVVIIAAHAFFNVAVVVRTVGGFWFGLDDRVEEAASALGASPRTVFWKVTVPRLRPALLSAAAITFLFTFTSFGVIVILGGARRATLETEIFRYAVTRTDFSTAAVLSLVQMAFVLALVMLNGWAGRRVAQTERGVGAGRRVRTRADRVVVAGGIGSTGIVLAAPLLTLIERSLRSGDGYGLVHYRALATESPALPVSALRAIANSLAAATVAMVIAVVVGATAAWVIAGAPRWWSRTLEVGLLLPLGTSAVTIGFGMLLALDQPPLDLRQSWWIIPIAQALIGTPFVVRSLVPVLRSVAASQREAAAVLGATPWQVWRRIDLPLARPALLLGAGFAFAISLGEFGATSFVGRRPGAMTVPLAIARLVNRPGELLRGQAMALSVLLMAVTVFAVVTLDRSGDQALL